MAVTMQQIGELAGVSRGTVDRVLNRRGRVKPEVSKRIFAIAQELGYVVKSEKKAMRQQKHYRIGVITQLSSASFMEDILKGIENAKNYYKSWNVEVILRRGESVDESEQLRLLRELEAEGMDALALMPVESKKIAAHLNDLVREKHIPVVTFNSDTAAIERTCFVGMDNRQSGLVAAGLMASITEQSGSILIVIGHFANFANINRVEGFVSELRRICPRLEIANVQASFDDEAEVEKIVSNALLTLPNLQGILICSGGQRGIARAFQKMNLEKRPKVIVYDQTKVTEQLLMDGAVDFLIDQNGYYQGYMPIKLLAYYFTQNYQIEERHWLTEIRIKNSYNLSHAIHYLDLGKKELSHEDA